MPDGIATGPFQTEQEAIDDANIRGFIRLAARGRQVKIPAGTIVGLAGEVHTVLKGDLEVRHSISAELLDEVPALRIVAVNIHGVNLVVQNCRVENGVINQTHES